MRRGQRLASRRESAVAASRLTSANFCEPCCTCTRGVVSPSTRSPERTESAASPAAIPFDASIPAGVKSLVKDDTYYPDRVAGETWYIVTAIIDLLVVVDYPTDPDGIINYVVPMIIGAHDMAFPRMNVRAQG